MSTELPAAATPPNVEPLANEQLLSALRERLGRERVSTRTEDRAVYSRDMWTRGLLAIAAGKPPGPLPSAIVWPQTSAEVQAIILLARRYRVPIVPFGAGSGVTGAAVPEAGGLVIDMKRMRALHIDAERNVITCEPGMNGMHLEERLNRRGLTLGHFPSSIMCSTVGGWVATRGAGQLSSKYGKIEDLVTELQLVTGAGQHLRVRSGDEGGPDFLQLMVGSEGTLGCITSATFTVRPLPAARLLRGYWFPDVTSGYGAMRHLLQLGLRPAVVRLYDELDTLMSGAGRHAGSSHRKSHELAGEVEGAASWLLSQLGSRVGKIDLGGPDRPALELEDLLKLLKPDAERARSRLERWLVQTVLTQAQPINRLIEALMPRFSVGCLLIVGFEGEPELTTAEEDLARRELLARGARDLGEEPGQHWLRHRYDVSFKLPKAFSAGAFADTIEVATTWDRLGALYREVRAAVGQNALVMAHFSHAYTDGCSIYFTFIGRALTTSSHSEQPEDGTARLAEDRRRYDGIWQAAMQAALRVGATISHHHGIGKLRAPHMAAEHGQSLGVLRALKRVCDPDGLCNPGKLLPTAPPGQNSQVTRRPGPPLDSLAVPQAVTLRRDALLAEAQCDLPLWQLERELRTQGLTLSGLPPWAWQRPLGAALATPQPSEASLLGGRLRDRVARITVRLKSGHELAVPPTPAPRRSTGPDLGQVWLGGAGALGAIKSALLRVNQRLAPERWAGLLLDDEEQAMKAIFAARSLHGGTVLSELVLVHRDLLARTLDLATAPKGRLALLVASSAPEPVASRALALLIERLGGDHAQLPAAACRDLYRPDALFESSTQLAAVTQLVSGWPPYERPLRGSLAEQVAILRAQTGPYLVCGVYLHGATLRSTQAGDAAAQPDPLTDAQAALWPSLQAAYLADLESPESAHA